MNGKDLPRHWRATRPESSYPRQSRCDLCNKVGGYQNLIKPGYDPKCVDTIWKALDQSPREDFMQSNASIKLKRTNVVAICGLHRRKGVFDIIDAYASVFVDFPEWRLHIAGEGPIARLLDEQVQRLGLTERIELSGFVVAPKTLL